MNRMLIAALAPSVLAAGATAQCSPGWVSFPALTGTAGHALLPLPDGNLIVAGSFSAANGTPASLIAHVDTTTLVCSPLGSGTSSSSILQCLARLPNGDILTGGNHSSLGGVTTNKIGRFSQATQTWSDIGYGTQGGVVYAIQVMPGGNEIIVGGDFSRAQTIAVNHVARCNLLTNTWSSVGSNMTTSGDSVKVLALAPDGTVIVGGSFFGVAGTGSARIARLNPGNNTWSALGTGCNNNVEAIVVMDDGDIIAAGYFTLAGGVACNRMARFDVQTGTWSAIGGTSTTGMNYINDLTRLPSGELIVGGSFTFIGGVGGVTANRIARYNPDTGVFSALISGVNSDVRAVAPLLDGRLAVTGNFTGRLAAYSFGGTPPTISSPPSDLNRCGDGPAVFTVSAAGTGPLSFQWRFNTVPIDTTANPSAATDTLSLPAASPADNGAYTVTVTNSCGPATSPAAALTVNTADFNGDGDIGTDADIEAFFACLGGNCCPTCGSADLNADGDTGTDADIESFFRVLGGGSC